MRILLTNDDGIDAPGFSILETLARNLSDDIWVVAPAEEQSGKGHSISLTQPLRYNKRGERRFAVSGTPTDAVMLALRKIMGDDQPDLILSGVNRGANMAEDLTYSGTVSAAMEGALAGIRSIALSQSQGNHREGLGDKFTFAAAQAWGERVLRPLLSAPIAANSLFNVNFPALAPDSVKGIRIVAQGFRDAGRFSFVTNRDPRGYNYHWMALGEARQTPGHATDLEAIAEGYIAVTPLHLDMTDHRALTPLSACFDAADIKA